MSAQGEAAPVATTLALVRHGQTEWNVRDLLQGSSDTPLNDTGRHQAALAGRLLSAERWDRVVASPLVRALDTATVIAAACGGLPIEIDPGLVERDYGAAEGLTKEEATARFGESWPGVESYDDLRVRATAVVDAIARRHAGERVVVATHGTFIRAFADVVAGVPTIKPANAHAVHVTGAPGAWRVTAGLRLA